MTDLTDKWKNGELEQDWYYIQYKNNIIDIEFAQCYCVGKFANMDVMKVFFENDCDVEEVLAPVPDYEELRELKEENARQKELLKECQTRITDCLYKIYDEGGHSYPSLEEELKASLSKLRRYWNEKN